MINFSTENQGFNRDQVAQYIELLSAEYRKAVEANQKLSEALADKTSEFAKLQGDLSQAQDQFEAKKMELVSQVMADAKTYEQSVKARVEAECDQILHDANQQAAAIQASNQQVLENLQYLQEFLKRILSAVETGMQMIGPAPEDAPVVQAGFEPFAVSAAPVVTAAPPFPAMQQAPQPPATTEADIADSGSFPPIHQAD